MDSIVSQYFMEFSSLDRLLLWWVPILLSYDCLLPIALTFMLNVHPIWEWYFSYFYSVISFLRLQSTNAALKKIKISSKSDLFFF